MNIVAEFRKFIARGNVLDLAVGVVIVAIVREWNIRRHESTIGDWPRAEPRKDDR